MRTAAGALVLALSIAPGLMGTLHAQFTPADCASIAANAIANPTRNDTLSLVRYCPDTFGDAISALLSNRTIAISDTGTYFNIIGAAHYRVNPDVFLVATELAGDSGAPDIMRLGGLVIQRNYNMGRASMDARALYGYRGAVEDCSPWAGLGTFLQGTETLGSSSQDSMHQVARTVLASDASNALKYVAYCIFHETVPIQSSPFRHVPNPYFHAPTHFSYVKQCGRKFLLRNSSNAWVTVKLAWPISPSSGDDLSKLWSMPPKPEGSSYSENTWTVPGGNRHARILWGTTVLMDETPNDTPC